MRDLLPAYDAWRGEGLRVGRAVVIRTIGSAPRHEGAVLLVAEDGRMIGSVSGGCVEGAAAEEVARAMASGRSREIRYGITDAEAWGVGLACGGTIDVLAEPDVSPAIVDAARTAGATAVTRLPPDAPLVGIVRSSHGPGDTEADSIPPEVRDEARDALRRGLSRTIEHAGTTWFLEAYPAPPRLVAVGATEVTRHLVDLAHALGYATIVVDPRAAFATDERFPTVDDLRVEWPDEAFEAIDLGPNDAVAVLSHDPKVDEPAIVEAIQREAAYVGAVGSRKSQADRRARLVAAGLSDAQLEQLHGPIGLDLGGREPVETALAVMAEIVAARRGGTGRPLIEVRKPMPTSA